MRIHQRKVTVAEAHPSKFNVEICGEQASCRSRRWGWACRIHGMGYLFKALEVLDWLTEKKVSDPLCKVEV